MADQMVLEGEWLTVSQVAARLGVTTQHVNRLTQQGRLTCQATPLGRLWPGEAVTALKLAREAGHATEDD